jgi:DNA-binding helix-hairpin-helix protein with protein kinase domain
MELLQRAANWDFQILAARNLAVAFDEVHKACIVVGDINESNVFVSANDALVRLIDCDSFQITPGHLCRVGKPEFTPPELQGPGVDFANQVRTITHDEFGLAVLIYRLLFVGNHPYAAISPGAKSLNDRIRDDLFPHGENARHARILPLPCIPEFSDIPKTIRSLFQRAFKKVGPEGKRPSAREWITALSDFKRA